ncbi:L-glutamate gamma-semialdehyde dehydrogenase [Desulfosarcina ovata]|uniref:L-glutamate gamma-semialdehyde dehydrogenase n=1 Tax=Desulfosarcina ovata subsp. ovata TaxID=2752305 RepID=A0A5K8AD92_9BACT|nr:L-glutamate gamma-semialdehyde dehydrogenase [Desulfosarcina ovata]BBO90509.1 1-pyrroline-5-carboxylate dehydrogenase [Desulfosarcina ovata subsp. ovata]
MNLLNNSIIRVPEPVNEPQFDYAVNSAARSQLKRALSELAAKTIEIPLIIGGREVNTGNRGQVVMPHQHAHKLADYHQAGEEEARMAIQAAMDAKTGWQRLRWEERAAIFLKAAELISGKYRFQINAASMLSTSKNAFQAEIDAACELIDFLRFNVYFAQTIYAEQPLRSSKGTWNYTQYRPLEGFVLAVTPFNFTAIAGNLAAAPAIMGNTVILKPASSSVYTPWLLMQIFKEAGLPDGVINFLPGPGSVVGDVCLASPHLGGVHFTGSTAVFQHIWKTIGKNITSYRAYPRIVGETGGKDFIFAHASADVDSLATACVRGAFEFQGQKCSAASRAYIPESLWPRVRGILETEVGRIKMGPVTDFRNFVNAVIDKGAFDTIRSAIEYAKTAEEAKIVTGGGCDDSQGYFIEPTIILTTNPKFKTMQEEIFGPVLTVYVYPDEDYPETLKTCDETSVYGLTGAIFANDRQAISQAMAALENAAGNFYINDKPTGAVVGQQPFGGARASGTNDKAGAASNLMRWVSPRTIKESFDAAGPFDYPFMQAE